MSYYIKIKLTIAGSETENFSIYAYHYDLTTLLVSGVSKVSLLNGFNVLIPDTTTQIGIQSNTTMCNNIIFIPITLRTPTPTPTQTLTSTPGLTQSLTPTQTLTSTTEIETTPTPTPTPTPSVQVETIFIHIPNL